MRDHPAYARWWARAMGWTMPVTDHCVSPHPSVEIDGVSLDQGIAGLVELLWSKGVETFNSCQGDLDVYRRTGGSIHGSAAYLTVGSVDAAVAVLRTLEEVSGGRLDHTAVTFRPSGSASWFVEFDPAALPQEER